MKYSSQHIVYLSGRWGLENADYILKRGVINQSKFF